MNTQKKQTVEAMQSQIDFLTKKLDFISHNAETVLQGKTIKETIKDILRSIRDYYNADSAYIFEINYKDNRIINTFETYAKGVDAEKQHTDELPFSFLDFWEKEWGLAGHLCVPDLSKYDVKNPELAKPYIELMQEQGIRSLVYVPLMANHSMKGFIGVDNARSYADDVDFIITMGHYISLQLTKRQQEKEQYQQYRKAEAFIDSLADSSPFAAQINLTKNYVETIQGTSVFIGSNEGMVYTENVELFCRHMDKNNRAIYENTFSRDALLASFAAGTDKVKAELYYCGDDGHFIWARSTARLMQHPDTGDIIAFLYQTDITEEKIQEMIMKNVIAREYDYVMCVHALENRSTVISNNVRRNDYMDIHDTDDYMASSQAYGEKYLHPEDMQSFMSFIDLKNVWHALGTHDVCSKSFCVYIDGKPYYKKLDFYCINHEYRLFLYIRTDFTETQKLKQQQDKKLLRALTAAEQANAAKTQFLSRMSHDIRTPLSSIIGMTELAQAARDHEEIKPYLDKISLSSHYLSQLVNDILDLTKIDSGKIVLHKEPYSEDEFVACMDAIIRPLCQAKNIDLKIKLLSSPDWILVDKVKYTQVYLNILSNAVKFTPAGGHISMSGTKQLEKDKMILTTVIRDDGIGMSKEFQKRLFKPFEQEHAQGDNEGSGLGLAIAHRLIQLMGGTITAESQLGKGTTFTITLPVTRTDPQPQPQTPAMPDISISGKHILVAEDNEINEDLLKLILEKNGAIVTTAQDGKEVVKLFKDSDLFTYDAILMDVRMPKMSGIEATKAIRKLHRKDACTIPIIATTANAYGEEIGDCLKAGMNAHMSKPIEPNELLQLLSCYMLHD